MQHELQAYAVKDIKSGLFALPHFVQTNGVAIRSFATACEDPSTQLNKYPSDFSLYHVGAYNGETGRLIPSDPVQLSNASEFVDNETPLKFIPPESMKETNL